MVSPRGSPFSSMIVSKSASAWNGWYRSHCMLSTGTREAAATSRRYPLPTFQSTCRMAITSLYRPRISPISLAVSPWAIWVVLLSMNWAWPPSCAIPASNDARVRVLEKKNSIASTLSSSRAWGCPRARRRFRSSATSRTESISPLVHSWQVIRSRPRSPVRIVAPLSLGGAQHEGEQGHAHHDTIKGLFPVAGVVGDIDVLRQLVHAGQRVEDDRVSARLLQQLPCHPVVVGGRRPAAAGLLAALGVIGLHHRLHVNDIGVADHIGNVRGLAERDPLRHQLRLELGGEGHVGGRHEDRLGVELGEGVAERMHRPHPHVTAAQEGKPVDGALLLEHGVEVGENLRGMLAPPVAGIDD